MSDQSKLRDELLHLLDHLERSIDDDDIDGAKRVYATTDDLLRRRSAELVPQDRDELYARTQSILERVIKEAGEVRRAIDAVQRSTRAQSAYAARLAPAAASE
jgi:hypothetical protein